VLDSVAPKLVRSATLRSMFESYSRSVTDPNDELVHLYDVRDALSGSYGNDQSARDAWGSAKRSGSGLAFLRMLNPLSKVVIGANIRPVVARRLGVS
jgi:hypothetical protein